MRAALSVVALAVAVDAQSPATNPAYTQALQACQAPVTARLAGNTVCAQQFGVISSAITGIDSAAVANYCATGCVSFLAAAYADMATCLTAYEPTLLAALKAEGVQNPELVAATYTVAFTQIPKVFNLICTFNEHGDACMPLYSRMATDLSLASNTPNVCAAYYNTGCCLQSLDDLYMTTQKITTITPISFIDALKGPCPIFENFNPPKCVSYGQTAVAVDVKLPLNGLICSVYNAQSEEFKKSFEAALKQDLAAAGIGASFTTIKGFVEVNGVCNVQLVVRAGTDAATRDLTATITAANASFTQAAQAATASSSPITNGAITMDEPSFNEVTLTGQQVTKANAGSALSPSLVLVAFFTLLMKFF